MKRKLTLILGVVLLISIAAPAQDLDQKQRLKLEAENFISMYNTGDTTAYRTFLTRVIPEDKALLESTLVRYRNTFRTIGEVEVKDLIYKSPKDVELIVQEKKFDSWWKFHIMTDEDQKFLSRTVLPIPLPEIGLKGEKKSKAEVVKELDNYIQTRLADGFNGNVYIYEKGMPFYERSFGANPEGHINTATTRFGLASAGKMFTSVLIFKLQEEGKLSLQDPVRKFLPELQNEALHNISVEQLLTHTSGMGDFFEDPNFQGSEAINTSEGFLPFIEADRPSFPAGEGFRYSNTGFSLLGIIIERAAGMPFQELVKKNIFDPLDMKNSVAGMSAGGGISTAGDMHIFLNSLNRGKILNRDNTHLLMTYTVNGSYGYGTEHHLLGREHIVGHSGGYINECVELNIYPESDHIVVILSNSNPPFGHFLSNKVKELLLYK